MDKKTRIAAIVAIAIVGFVLIGLYVWQTKSDDKAGEEAWEGIKESDKRHEELARRMRPLIEEYATLDAQLETFQEGTPEHDAVYQPWIDIQKQIAAELPMMVQRYDATGNPLLKSPEECKKLFSSVK